MSGVTGLREQAQWIICISWFPNPGLLPLQYKGQERPGEEEGLEQGWERGVVWTRAYDVTRAIGVEISNLCRDRKRWLPNTVFRRGLEKDGWADLQSRRGIQSQQVRLFP